MFENRGLNGNAMDRADHLNLEVTENTTEGIFILSAILETVDSTMSASNHVGDKGVGNSAIVH
jgi:hypothetical protein